MSYTAKIKSKSLIDGVLGLVVEYSDGVNVTNETYSVKNISDIKRLIKARVSELEALDSGFNNLQLGDFDLTPEPVVPPTPKELNKNDYENKLNALAEKKRELELGIIDQKEYDGLLATVKIAKDRVL